jgi:hypothetical protein
MAGYSTYENWQSRSTEHIRIHTSSCIHVIGREEEEKATGEWVDHETYADALAHAEGRPSRPIENCKKCNPHVQPG